MPKSRKNNMVVRRADDKIEQPCSVREKKIRVFKHHTIHTRIYTNITHLVL